jgi:hypothetical protein
MALIDHIHLIAALHWSKLGTFDNFPDVIDPSVAGGVNFNHIEGGTRRYTFAGLTEATGGFGRLILLFAVEGFRQNSGTRSFACTSRTSEQVSWGNPLSTDGIAEGSSDRLLPYQIGKNLRAIFVVQGFVAHEAGVREDGSEVRGTGLTSNPGKCDLNRIERNLMCRCCNRFPATAPA